MQLRLFPSLACFALRLYIGSNPEGVYGSVHDGYQLPAIPIDKAPEISSAGRLRDRRSPTIIVDTARSLYFVMPEGKAATASVSVARSEWSGTARVAMKRVRLNPPAPMIRRQPELAKYRGGWRLA